MAQSQSNTGNFKLNQKPQAPPVYRPQPIPKVLQTKKAGHQQPSIGAFPVRPLPPPVYHPAQSRIVQPKNAATAQAHQLPKAPPVCRPVPKLIQPQQQKLHGRMAVQMKRPEQKLPNMALNAGQAARSNVPGQTHVSARLKSPVAEATRTGLPARVAPREAQPGVQLKPKTNVPSRSIQRYQVLSGKKILSQMPSDKDKPWYGYPYAVIGGSAKFLAQEPALGVGGGDEFLTQANGNRANIVNLNGQGISLRVSDDCSLAIEDSGLTARQPKAFYATQDVANASNQLLIQAGSKFRLNPAGTPIQILTGWHTTKTLLRVSPLYYQNQNQQPVSPNRAPQNCNEMASQVMGMWNPSMSGGNRAVTTASRIGGDANLNGNDDASAAAYVFASQYFPERVKQMGANQHAQPEVGESFMIGTLGTHTYLPSGQSRVRDIESGQDRVLNWAFHFGGVVARSGNDRITLENYARGDNRLGNPDPRWYFQMYGQKHNQSFHEFHKAKNDYANPVTVNVRNHNLGPVTPLPALKPISVYEKFLAAMQGAV